ncbi:AIPR family protein [Amycolatopsis thermoflava]|uniref:AIPR family protein n=1 Tax=Amycolatopsis thermoflava TaxID=84480 RepID=UPI003664D766
MSKLPSNAETLVGRIFDAWKTENFPDADGGVAFEIFASELALRSYGLLLEEIQAGIVGGGQDGAIDSIYVFFDDVLLDDDSEVLSTEARATDFGQDRPLELWIVQAKRSPAFAEEALDKLENSLRRLLDLSLNLDDLSDLYNSSVRSRMALFRSAWEKLLTRRPRITINVLYASTGDRNAVNPQVEAKLRALESAISERVPDAERISVDLLGSKELLARYNERPSYSLPMRYQESATSGQSHVALVKLEDYYSLIVDDKGRLRRHLFEWNVRDYQGNVSVNQDIRRSLTDENSPEFWWLNNGVTIICSDATSAGKIYSLTDIQIVNGLQTSHEIFEAMKHGVSDDLVDRMLLVRIIVTSDAVTRDQVIRATNRQTAVTDASLRATDEVQRNIEDYFITKGWYYDRRKNFYKNEGKDPSKIVGIPLLGAAVTAMGLFRPDKARGKPSSLLKNDEDYKSVFAQTIDLETYFWVAQLQRRVDTFIVSDRANATTPQKSNLRYHLSMLIVDDLNGGPIRRPQQLRRLVSTGRVPEDKKVEHLFEKLKIWADDYTSREGVILERATKAQRFTDYLLRCAADERAINAVETNS